MTKVNKWTLGLAALGLVSIPATVQAEEKPNQLLTALSSTTISGYVDTSAHWVPGTGNANPPAFAYNTPNKQDGFNLNVVDIQIEKPLDEGTWSAGYKAELWFGPNASVIGNNIATGVGGDDVSLKQGYVALRAPVGNGVDLKIGTFDTIIGYEVANAGSNPNYTRSWGYSMEPTQQTGVLGSYQINKMFGVAAGIANLWSPGIGGGVPTSPRSESDKTYMAALTITAPDSMGFLSGSTLSAGFVDGYSTGFFGIANDVTSYYIGATLATPWKQLKVGASYDYARAHDNNVGGTGHAQALALYASLQATEKLSFHLRGEWADLAGASGSSGNQSTAFTSTNAALNSFVSGTGGIPSEVLSLTGTIQYDLWANVMTRLEVRWDHSLEGHRPFGGTVAGSSRGTAVDLDTGASTPAHISGGADEKNAVLVAANIIYKF